MRHRIESTDWASRRRQLWATLPRLAIDAERAHWKKRVPTVPIWTAMKTLRLVKR